MKNKLEDLIKKAIKNINDGVAKTLLARRDDELPPSHNRHLTDTRTRVSTLLEYSLAYEMNNILIKENKKCFVSNVLWNIFPDLILRDEQYNNIAGLEIKALHHAAEEKSANLSTPLSIIRKDKDFLIILLWGWKRGENGDRQIFYYPYIKDFGIFNAWLLAKTRDIAWLNIEKNRKKAIDISTPLLEVNEHIFKAEEGNIGKLMRIKFHDDIPEYVPDREEMKNEMKKFENFQNNIYKYGFEEISENLIYELGANEIVKFSNDEWYFSLPNNVGKVVLLNRKQVSKKIKEKYEEFKYIITFSDKLSWKVYENKENGFEVKEEGDKPETNLSTIVNSLTL